MSAAAGATDLGAEVGRTPPEAGVAVRLGRDFLGLARIDLLWIVLLVGVSLALRLASPIYPNILTQPGTGPPVTADGVGAVFNQTECAPDVPVGPNHAAVKRCGFVFDEVYFPVDAAKDIAGVDYFDPEPPLAKLLMAPPIASLGFTTWAWRVTPAVAGSLAVAVVYLIALRLRRDRFFAVAAAFLVAFDGLAFVEARTGVIDGVALLFVVLFYYAFLLHWQARTRRQWRATLYLLALAGGLSFGAKLNALAPAAIAAALIAGRWLEPWALRSIVPLRRIAGARAGEGRLWREAAGPRAAFHTVAAVLVVGSIFAATYSRYSTIGHTVYHFYACSRQNGLQGTPVNEPRPVTTLFGHTVPNPIQAIANIEDVTRAAVQYHQTECRGHPYASAWYTWPISYHPVLFYYQQVPGSAGTAVSSISDGGNLAMWWLAIPALLFCLWRMTTGPPRWRVGVALLCLASLAVMILSFHAAERPDTSRVHAGLPFDLGILGMVVFGVAAVACAVVSRRFVPAFIVLGYLTAWLMWAPGNADRVLFYYAMLAAVPFAALALAYALTALRQATAPWGGRRVSLAPVAYGAIGAVLACFVWLYPLYTGLPLSPAARSARVWLGW